MMVRFLMHFLWIDHGSRMINLFDSSDAIFSLPQPNANTGY